MTFVKVDSMLDKKNKTRPIRAVPITQIPDATLVLFVCVQLMNRSSIANSRYVSIIPFRHFASGLCLGIGSATSADRWFELVTCEACAIDRILQPWESPLALKSEDFLGTVQSCRESPTKLDISFSDD